MNPLLDLAAVKALPRRFTAESPTGFGALIASDPNIDPRFAALFAPRIVETDEEAIAINEAEDRKAREQADRDELLREREPSNWSQRYPR